MITEPVKEVPLSDKDTPRTAGQNRDDTEMRIKIVNAKRAFQALSHAIRMNLSDNEKQEKIRKFDTSIKELDDKNFTKLQ